MELENYLAEQEPQIIAISRISQIIEESISKNYYDILKGRVNKSYLENIRALVCAIQMISFAMRCYREECMQEIDSNYEDVFSFSSVVFEEL